MGFAEVYYACLAGDNEKLKEILARGDVDINEYGKDAYEITIPRLVLRCTRAMLK